MKLCIIYLFVPLRQIPLRVIEFATSSRGTDMRG